MKISKRVTLWALGFVCICTMSMYSTSGNAEEGRAEDADTVIMNKMMSHGTPQMQRGENPQGATAIASEDQKEKEAAQKVLDESLAQAMAENEDEAMLVKKLELAKAMHKIRPTREQVNSAVRRASLNLPQQERVSFVMAMGSMLNYNAIERISVDAMVETYSYKELEAMVEYFSKPEAKSASKKVPSWAMKVHPEIVRMIDRAMMRLKTGQ